MRPEVGPRNFPKFKLQYRHLLRYILSGHKIMDKKIPHRAAGDNSMFLCTKHTNQNLIDVNLHFLYEESMKSFQSLKFKVFSLKSFIDFKLLT